MPQVNPLQNVRVAINFDDIERIEPGLRQKMALAKRLKLKDPIKIDDQIAIEFGCPLMDAVCIIDTLRKYDKELGDYPTRAYLFRNGRWSRTVGNVPLSLLDETGKVMLNPKVFEVKPVIVDSLPLKIGPVKLGR